jgi:hypothetical protein
VNAARGGSVTYVYCIVSSDTPPAARRLSGPPGAGTPRAIEIRPHRYLIVSDAPADAFGEAPLAARLTDLDWVSRAAVAHDAVIESFMDAEAVVPMKIFTLFTNDARALEQVRSNWKAIETLIRRLSKQAEWGVRLVFDQSRAPAEDAGLSASSGRGYLMAKRQIRAAITAHTASMRKAAGGVLKTLAPLARESRQRPITAPAESRSVLLLDAAFLVPRTKAARFRTSVERLAKKLATSGYALQLSGPWPPYSFVEQG